ncbi:MAG: glycosyltransferase [Candidatus Woesebacteria bacterium]|jgi:GT2 family glycosyltransferase
MNKTNQHSVSTVIPNFNGLKLMQKNLPAVLRALRDGDELIIVDDASTDESVKWLKEKFNCKKAKKDQVFHGFHKTKTKKIKIKLLINQKNLRFAETCNRGVKNSKHNFIFLLNNDVSPEKDILSYLLAHFTRKKDQMFAATCLQIENNLGGIKGGKNLLWFEKGLFFHSRAKEFKSGTTAWASGGSSLFDKEKWLQLKGFDPGYKPAYWEDIDLSYRARKKGWQVLFEEKAVVEHNHQSTNIDVFGKDRIKKISWKASDRFTLKNGHFWQKLAFFLWRPYWWWKRWRDLK